MSQYHDIRLTTIAHCLQFNLPVQALVDLTADIIGCLEWEVDDVFTDLISAIGSMLNQSDGLYGVSHDRLEQYRAQLVAARATVK